MSNPVVGFIVDTIYNGLEYFGKYYSEYRAYVIDNEDPTKQGRLQLLVPGIIDEPSEYWAPSSGVFSGAGYGMHFIPPKNSLVWVMFENGNPDYPVWKHGYFGKDEIPAEKSSVKNFWIASPAGHSVELDDDEETIKISNLNGDVVTLSPKGISIQSKNIFLGTTDYAAEPAVMGTTLETQLDDLTKQITNLTKEINTIAREVSVTMSLLATPGDVANIYTSALATNMIAQSKSLTLKLTQSISKIETIDKSVSAINRELPKIKSKVVNLNYE